MKAQAGGKRRILSRLMLSVPGALSQRCGQTAGSGCASRYVLPVRILSLSTASSH